MQHQVTEGVSDEMKIHEYIEEIGWLVGWILWRHHQVSRYRALKSSSRYQAALGENIHTVSENIGWAYKHTMCLHRRTTTSIGTNDTADLALTTSSRLFYDTLGFRYPIVILCTTLLHCTRLYCPMVSSEIQSGHLRMNYAGILTVKMNHIFFHSSVLFSSLFSLLFMKQIHKF